MFARVTHRLVHDASVTRMRGAAPKLVRHASNMDSVDSVDMYSINLKARAELPCDVCRMVPALLAADAAVLQMWEDAGPGTRFLNRHDGYACLHSMSAGVDDRTPLQTGFLEFELRTKHKEDLAPMLNVYVEEMCKVDGWLHLILQSIDFEQAYNFTLESGSGETKVMRMLEGGLDDYTKRVVWPPEDPIDSLTVKRLKEMLREQNLKVSGPKQELRDRLRAHEQDEMN